MCLKWLSRQECWGTLPTLKEVKIHKKQQPHRGAGREGTTTSSLHTRKSQKEDERVTEMKYLWCNSWHCGLLLLQRPFSQGTEQFGVGVWWGQCDRQSIDGWYIVKYGKRVWKVMSSGKHVERRECVHFVSQPFVILWARRHFQTASDWWRGKFLPSTNDSIK